MAHLDNTAPDDPPSEPEIRVMTLRFNEALTGAAFLHAKQGRKGTDTPYVAHLLGVASIALEHGADEDEAIAALLHDAVEDAPKTLGPGWVRHWIEFRFGARVLGIVEGCTDTDADPKPPWRARKEAYIAGIDSEDRSVLLVSASDKLHNARAILTDFRTLREELWPRFKTGEATGAAVIGYYRGLVDAFTRRCETLGIQPPHPIATLVREIGLTVTAIESEAGIPGRWPLP